VFAKSPALSYARLVLLVAINGIAAANALVPDRRKVRFR
jgi:hypothetical protein